MTSERKSGKIRPFLSRRGFIGTASLGVAGLSSGVPLGARVLPPSALAALESTNLWDLPTPALVVDVDALEHNLDKMAAFYKDRPVGLRPHGKTHKCPDLAKMQLERGAIGVCAAKVSEAEVMLDAGIADILITSPVVTKEKIDRVIALAKRSGGVWMVIDQKKNAHDFNAAAEAAGITLRVLIDLNVGTDRTGITMGEPTLALAKTIAGLGSLKLVGVQAYAGHLQHIPGWEYRRQRSLSTMGEAVALAESLRREGHDIQVITGGGTGTYNIDCDVEGVTDMQVGSYLFMDGDYRRIGGKDSSIFDDFQPALFVLATAISQPVPGRITLDAGYKAMATDKGMPDVRNIEGVSYRWGGDEHGILQLTNPSRPIELGDKMLLMATHCDPTVNLHDSLVAFRGERIEAVWPVAGRGRSQ